jgi:hypothetical protein
MTRLLIAGLCLALIGCVATAARVGAGVAAASDRGVTTTGHH